MSGLDTELTKWLATWIEQAFAIGRAIGLAYPHDYDVGMKLLARFDNTFLVRVRVNDFTREVKLRFPTGRETRAGYEYAVTQARNDIASAATQIASEWLDAHPMAFPADKLAAAKVSMAEIEQRIQALPAPSFTRIR